MTNEWHKARADANRRINAAAKWVDQYRPMTTTEAAAKAAQHRAKAAALLASIQPEPTREIGETRVERIAAHTAYQSGGWQDHYRALAGHRREASITEMRARQEEMSAEALDRILGDEDRAYLDTLAHDLAYAEYHTRQVEADGAHPKCGDLHGPMLARMCEIGVPAAIAEARTSIANIRARLRRASAVPQQSSR